MPTLRFDVGGVVGGGMGGGGGGGARGLGEAESISTLSDTSFFFPFLS